MIAFLIKFFRKMFRINQCAYMYFPMNLPEPLDEDLESHLLDLVALKDLQARNTLIEHNLRLVVYIAKRFESPKVMLEDLISIGSMGLIKGIETFKKDKNIKLATYCSRCIENEIARQIDLLESGQKVIQETRRWDDAKGMSFTMRSKEDAQDYRYFPDPDLVPIHISDEWLEEIRSKQPEFRDEKRARYREEYQIPDYDIDIITNSKKLADIFEDTIALGAAPKKVSNWLMVETMRLLKENVMDPEDIKFTAKNLAKLIKLVDARTINGNVAKEVFEHVFAEDIDPEAYVKEHGLATVNDEGALKTACEAAIAGNSKAVEDYKGGKEKALGALVGQVMKAMKGKADPGSVNQMLRELLK